MLVFYTLVFSVYIRLELTLMSIGVKYVHHTAAKYDIGVYFEANGHGTALIRGHVIEQLKTLLKGQQSEKRAVIAIERILALHQLINQAVNESIKIYRCLYMYTFFSSILLCCMFWCCVL